MLLDRRRILVVGSGGAGKSTFARELAKRTGLPLVHLDDHYWKPGWVPAPPAEWEERVRQLAGAESWIIDGNYGGTLELRVPRCDAIVFFDLPRLSCLGGVLRRWLVSPFRRRPGLPEGCREKIDVAFLRWIWDFPRNSRPRIMEAIRKAGREIEVVRITHRAEARAILDRRSLEAP